MKLFYKVYFFLLVLLILLLGVSGYIGYHREVTLFSSDMERHALLLGRSLSGLIEHVWRESGPEKALSLIHDANKEEHRVQLRWVWLGPSADVLHKPQIPFEKLENANKGHSVSLVVNKAKGEKFRITYVPVNVDENHPGALEISEPLFILDRYTHRSLLHFLFTTALLLVVVGVLLWNRFQKWIHQPLSQFINKSLKIGEGDLTPDLKVPGHDEFTQLAKTLNSMCQKLDATYEKIRVEHEQRIATLEQLRHTERLATLGRLSAGMAHELGTPLNVISGRAKMIRSCELEQNEISECSRIINEQAERIASIMRNLLDFARRRPLDKSLLDIEQIVRQTLEMLASTAQKARVTFDLVKNTKIPLVPVDRMQLQQVVTNLVVNAIQAMPKGGQLVVTLGVEQANRPAGKPANQDYLVIRVKDQGEGIKQENMHHLFEPFFTTKKVGAGTGLGLSIAFGIVEEHGGWIDVESKQNRGACFSVFLPLEVSH